MLSVDGGAAEELPSVDGEDFDVVADVSGFDVNWV